MAAAQVEAPSGDVARPVLITSGRVTAVIDESPHRFGLRWYLLIYGVCAVVYAAVAWPHTHPPYMDSFYYVDIARNLARGQGLTERFVWNYLAGMPTLPHPSSAYWLPGLSLLLAPILALGTGYHGATLATAALAALCPTLAALIGQDIFGTRRHSLTMAGLTLFNGIWFHDWTTPDAFVLYAVLATAALCLAYRGIEGRGRTQGNRYLALSGLVAGLASLTRQEGVLLLLAILLAAAVTREARRRLWPGGFAAAIGLFCVAQLPWVAHTLATVGSPLASAGNRTLWMRSYDSFYNLHAELLSLRAYLSWGLPQLLAARLHAAVFTLEIWSALWLIVLVPLLVGMWRLRRKVECRPFLCYWVVLALAMPLVFTATLEHGTLQHASGALIPFSAALVVSGLDTIAKWLAGRRRGARASDSIRFARNLGIIAVGLSAAVSLGMTWQTFPAHGDEYTHDAQVVSWLHRHNPPGTPVMVLDPPAFAYLDDPGYYVVAPSDGLDAARTVARRYGVRYWALDPLHARSQDGLFSGRVHLPWLNKVAVVDGDAIYEIRHLLPR